MIVAQAYQIIVVKPFCEVTDKRCDVMHADSLAPVIALCSAYTAQGKIPLQYESAFLLPAGLATEFIRRRLALGLFGRPTDKAFVMYAPTFRTGFLHADHPS